LKDTGHKMAIHTKPVGIYVYVSRKPKNLT
jgi:hypothetical protein